MDRSIETPGTVDFAKERLSGGVDIGLLCGARSWGDLERCGTGEYLRAWRVDGMSDGSGEESRKKYCYERRHCAGWETKYRTREGIYVHTMLTEVSSA